jgi:predicted DCC family thiol-disulfide oxidoreductase YuxK
MIFLVFYKWGMQFVKWWGMQFFVISLLIINLSYLPHIEIVLWLMIFFPIKKVQKSVSIIYDDHCNLCKKAMLFFKKYNFNNRYEFIALSKNRALYEEYNLNEKEVKTYMVGWYKGKLLKGYDLYFRLILVNPLFWFLVPLFILGYLGGVGKIIYNWIAERRYKIFGQCELSFEDEIQSTHVPKQFTLKTTFVTYFYGVFLVLISLFILLKFPYVGDIVAPKVPASIKGISQKAIFRVGLEIPVVFNETDLSMGDNWMVIYRKEVDSEWRLVPIVAEDGHRLNYDGIDILHYTNHNSDFLYFGTSLRYRRSILTIDDFQEFHSNGYGKESIVKRISYDYKYMDLSNLVEYKVTVYSNNSSKVKHWVSIPERHEKVEMFKNEYVYDGVELKTK